MKTLFAALSFCVLMSLTNIALAQLEPSLVSQTLLASSLENSISLVSEEDSEDSQDNKDTTATDTDQQPDNNDQDDSKQQDSTDEDEDGDDYE